MRDGEKYQPTPEESSRAESMMTPEQRAATEERELFKFQEREPFKDEKKKFTPELKRRPPTEKERQRVDAELRQLGDLFADSGVRWQLDGAINISLLTRPPGEYIGAHKDVDVSVIQDDIAELDAALGRRGYGIFENRLKDGKDPDSNMVMERLGAAGVTGQPEQRLMIARIDAAGKLAGGAELDFVDLHVVRQTPDGRPIGPFGRPLPEKWYQADSLDVDGREIKVSDPSLVAYFKLREGRAYDLDDVKHLVDADRLTRAEFDEIAAAIEDDLGARRGMVAAMVGEVIDRVGPGASTDEFVRAFLEHPRVAGRVADAGDPQVGRLAAALTGRDKLEVDAVTAAAFEAFDLGAYDKELRGRVRQLDLMIRDREDQKALEAARQNLESLPPGDDKET